MIRGTSVVIRCNISNIAIEDIESVYLSIKQDEVLLEKTDYVIEKKENKTYILFNLTQQDTFGLNVGRAELQVRIKKISGDALASKILEAKVTKILKDEII